MQITTHHGPTTTARIVYGGLGAFFVGVTLCVLLADLASLWALSTGHLMTVAALVGAITSGLFFGPTLRKGHLLTACGLALAFSGATTYCVVSSAGRADDAAYEANAKARDVNAERARYQRDLAEAKGRYNSALTAETAECSGGDGGKCKAKRTLTAQARSAVEVATIMVANAKPEAREDGKLVRASQVFAMATGYSEETSLRGFKLTWPFLPPLVCELLAIIFVHKAFAHRRRQPSATQDRAATLPSPPGQPLATIAQPLPVVRMSRRQVLEFVRAHLETHATLPAQADVARGTGVNKGTVSKWLRDWERAGLLTRTRDGRSNVIALASAKPTLRLAR